MTSEQTFSTGDLRASAQDYKRDSDHKYKRTPGAVWAAQAGWRSAPAGDIVINRAAPKYASSPGERRWIVNHYGRIRASNKTLDEHRASMSRRHEMIEGHADSSCDEDVVEPSAAPEPDAEITYSFDAERGPSQGSQVLGQALAKAVERYENKVTDKIVKDEYEVLDSDGEPVAPRLPKKAVSKVPAVVDEDDYEFV